MKGEGKVNRVDGSGGGGEEDNCSSENEVGDDSSRTLWIGLEMRGGFREARGGGGEGDADGEGERRHLESGVTDTGAEVGVRTREGAGEG